MAMSTTVLLTRTAGDNQRIAPLFAGHGFTVLQAPMITLQPLPRDQCGIRAVRRLAGDCPVMLTSAYAADLWLDMRETDFTQPPACYYLVGQRAQQIVAAGDPGVPVRAVAGSAAELCALIPASVQKILYPCSAERRPEPETALRARGVQVIDFPLYQPLAPVDAGDVLARALAAAGTELIVVFFSPSAVHHFFGLNPELPPHTGFAAIGPTTAEALARHGIAHPVMADRPDAGVLAGLLAIHQAQNRHG